MDELKEYYAQVTQALTAVREMTGRIDDQMGTLIEKIDGQEIKLDKLTEDIEEINDRVSYLESNKESIKDVAGDLNRLEVKVAALEMHHQRHGVSKWSLASDIVVKLVWAVAAVVVICRFGFVTMP